MVGATTTGLYKRLLYSEAQVTARIAELAMEIVARYDSQHALFVCLLNGGLPFAAKLMQAIEACDPNYHPNLQSMIVSRYGHNREPGVLRMVTDLPPASRDLTGKQVILLDDLVDAGDTTAFARKHLLDYGATSVDVIVLVKKLRASPAKVNITMYGFTAPDVWLTGMGMDDERITHEANRWAGWIAEANSN